MRRYTKVDILYKQKLPQIGCSSQYESDNRLKVTIFLIRIKARTTGLFRVEVGDTCNQRSRITLMQVIEQLSQRRLLRIGIGVAGCLAVTGKPSHILHAYGEDILR